MAGSSMWRVLKSMRRGRIDSRKTTLEVGSEEAIVEKEPEPKGLCLLNVDLPTMDEASSETYEVDIVAIHGLNGTALGTWTRNTTNEKAHKKTSILWLRDLLPKDLPGARIFTYGYDSKVMFSKSKATTEDYAQSLLLALQAERKHGQERRPIIFIAHSLGGLVCKQALIRANQNEDFNDILISTNGILFFGTPHRGASGAPEMASFLGTVFDKMLTISGPRFFKGGVNTDLINGLKANAPDLSRIAEAFSHLCKPPLSIVTIYETEEQPPLGQLIVEKSSAVMGIHGEKQIPGHACHREICRFTNSSDPDYKIILSSIVDLCRKTCYVSSLKESEKACVRVFHGPLMNEYRLGLPERVDGTCEWVLSNPQYRSWVHDPQASLLWVTGHSGSGKTTLSSYITEHLGLKGVSTRADPIVCCFFCNEGIEDQRDANAILRSLIFQILIERRYLVRHVKSTFDYDKDGTHILKSYDRLWSIFNDLICDSQLGQVSIIIDAVDECEKTSRKRLMESIAKLIDGLRSQSSRCVRFLVTSRPSSIITTCFTGYKPQRLPLEEKGSEIERDLQLVIHQRVGKIATRIEAKQDTIALMERSLTENADRTFLWLKFTLDILDDELLSSPGDLRRILAELPRDLEEAYEHYLRKVPHGQEDFAIKIFSLIIASFRPLSLDEVNTVISLHEAAGSHCHDLALLKQRYLYTNMEADIWQVLSSLIRISDKKVYLVHLSLKEYLCESIQGSTDKRLIDRYHVDLEEAHMFVASACMSYLVLDDFSGDLYSNAEVNRRSSPLGSSQSSHREPTAEFEAEEGSEDSYGIFGDMLQEKEEVDVTTCILLARRYIFFDYSATYWTIHFAQSQDIANKDVQDLALRLSDEKVPHQVDNWLRFLWINSGPSPEYPSNFDQLVIAAFFDHYTSLETLLSRPDASCHGGLPTALYWASREGHHRSVTRLLQTDVNPGVDDQKSLKIAAEFGHLDVVKALKADSRVETNCGTEDGTSPLLRAARGGYVEIVRFLLSAENTEAECKDFQGRTALHWAIYGGHIGVTQMLASDHRVDINRVDKDGRTPFSSAAEEGQGEIVELLLKQPGIDVDWPSGDGRTPLSFAAEFGRSSVIKQLKRSGKLNISHSHKDKTGRNPFSWAALYGRDDTLQRLQRCKVPGIDEEDEYRWTPLFWALEAPTSTTVKTLLQSGAVAVNHRDHSGRTALSWTVSYGKEAILRVLLDAPRVDPLIKDNEGLTSLDWARKLEKPYILGVLEDFLQGHE